MPGRRFLPLFLLFLVVGALMTYQADPAVEKPVKPLKQLNGVVYGALEAAHSAYSWGAGQLTRLTSSKKDIRIRQLEQQVAGLKRQLAGTYALSLENARLKALLGLKDHTPKYVATANVISRGTSRWQNTFVIDAGSRQGIEKNMIAISPEGLAGKVIGVQKEYSWVLLINDIRFAAAVRIEPLGQEAIFAGNGGLDHCDLKYVTSDKKIQKGDMLTTSGLDGLFPAGIRVGYVSGISSGDGFFKEVQVTPYTDTARLEQVTIIRK